MPIWWYLIGTIMINHWIWGYHIFRQIHMHTHTNKTCICICMHVGTHTHTHITIQCNHKYKQTNTPEVRTRTETHADSCVQTHTHTHTIAAACSQTHWPVWCALKKRRMSKASSTETKSTTLTRTLTTSTATAWPFDNTHLEFLESSETPCPAVRHCRHCSTTFCAGGDRNQHSRSCWWMGMCSRPGSHITDRHRWSKWY